MLGGKKSHFYASDFGQRKCGKYNQIIGSEARLLFIAPKRNFINCFKKKFSLVIWVAIVFRTESPYVDVFFYLRLCVTVKWARLL